MLNFELNMRLIFKEERENRQTDRQKTDRLINSKVQNFERKE